MTKAVAKKESTALAHAEPSVELKGRMLDIKENLESVEDLKLPRAKMTADGFELMEGEEPVTELEGVILLTQKKNVYYKDSYNPKDVGAPTCFSNDGVKPDASILKPVHATCHGCPMAEFGTNSMKSGKACRNLKPLYMLMSDDAIIPRQVTITPASIKMANQYLMDLTERGLPYRKVKTKITAFKKDPRDTYMTLKFSKIGNLEPQRIADVEYLRNYWMRTMTSQAVDINEQPATEVKDNGEY